MFKKKIKFILVFFCLNLLYNCSNDPKKTEIAVTYDQQKAINICFEYGKEISDLSVYRSDNLETAILGDFAKSDKAICFKPIIPFSSGNEYAIYNKDGLIGTFTINSFKNEPTKLLAIYPTTDNVPENLLKIYLVFSQPMEEVGNVLDRIKVKNTTTNEEADIFLDLQTELWNKEHTRLTLWLDPGRIKTGLIPNKQKGLPILEGNDYEIYIDERWKAANGMPLDKNYIKKLIVGERDTKRPDLSAWNIAPPETDTTYPLTIELNEPLDAILLQESFNILNDQETLIEGQFAINHDENKLVFTPVKKWNSGKYTIEIASKLEDLAGNNLNHLFDEPLSQKGSSAKSYAEFQELSFTIQ